MCIASKNERGVIELLQDPLIRLVMDSDGVTEQTMIAILEQLRIALAAREQYGGARQVGVASDRRAHENFLQHSMSMPITEVRSWNAQEGMLWMEKEGLRLVIHLPLAKGYVRFEVIDHCGPGNYPDRLLGSGTLEDVRNAKDAAERMAKRFVGHHRSGPPPSGAASPIPPNG
jgi:hypothetical protein